MGTEDAVLGARIGAFLVDYVLSLVVAVALGVGFAVLLQSRGGVFLGVGLGFVAYFIVPEGLYGQTPGKRLLGVMVVLEDGSPCTMGASFLRNLLRLVDGILNYVVGLVVILLSDRRQRVGDHVAQIVVVRAR